MKGRGKPCPFRHLNLELKSPSQGNDCMMYSDQEISFNGPQTEAPSPAAVTSAPRRRAFWKTGVETALLALLLLFLLVRPFLLEPFYIPSASMVPTLREGDRVLVNKLSFRLGEPQRGEVVVFYGTEESGYPEEIYVKRIVGLPGEWILIDEGKTFVQGMPLDEAYVKKDPYSRFGPYQVPEGTYFVMGDNRGDSRDSRYWGTLPRENLIGKAVGIFWPMARIHKVR